MNTLNQAMSMHEVKSAARVLDVMELLATTPQGLRLNELARQLEIPKSSASSLLATLEGRGYVEAGPDGYRLAARFRSQWAGGDWAQLMHFANRSMTALVAQGGESAFLGVWTADWQVQYVDKVVSDNPLRYDVAVGTLRPAFCTSIGHVLLAGQDDQSLRRYLARGDFAQITPRTVTDPSKIDTAVQLARRCGYAAIADSHVLGASGVAAPIHGPSGGTLAGLAVIAPSPRFEPRRDELTAAVVAAARDISRSLSAPAAVSGATQGTSPPENRKVHAQHARP